MGWWGCGIMDGDSPLDAKAEIFELLGFPDNMDDDPTSDQIRVALNAQQLSVLNAYIDNQFSHFIEIQVLGYLIVTTGAVLEIQVKAAILEAISNDDWIEEDRQNVLEVFEQVVQNYDGIMVVLDYPDITDIMSNDMSDLFDDDDF